MLRSVFLSGVWMLAMVDGARAVESFVGRWAIDPAGCTSEGVTASSAPLVATSTSLNWFVSSCHIGKMYKIGQAVHIQARCSSEGKISSTPITLEARGDHMRVTWNGVKMEEMRRCK
jgi:hypothetical protein